MGLDLLINWQEYKTIVQGQEVTMELRPLTREYMILLSELFDEILNSDIDVKELKKPNISKQPNKKQKVSIDDVKRGIQLFNTNMKHQKYADPIFKNHVKNVKGLTINGKEPTAEQFANEPALTNLTVTILTELVVRSSLKFDEVKN